MKIFTLLITAITALNLQAAHINPTTRHRLNQLSQETPAQTTRSEEGEEEETSKYEPMIIEIDDQTALDSLIEAGVIVYYSRHNIYLTSVPTEMIGYVMGIDGIRAATSAVWEVNSSMDLARPYANVDALHRGVPMDELRNSDPQIRCYDGSGVVVGFCDTGFDATHIAFRDRISQIYHFDAFNGTVSKAVTPEEISAWTTDRADGYHATHVGNILAGGYKGNGYYGVAYGAELVATTSSLDFVGILSGVEAIIAYAKSQHKPAVINISLSSSMGARDGSDVMCRYLSYCSEDAIICISAGNTGQVNVYAGQDLSEANAELTIVNYSQPDVRDIKGYIDMWGDSDEPFEYCVGIYDGDTNQLLYTSPWTVTGDSIRITSDDDSTFAQYFDGKIVAYSELCADNRRTNVTIGYDMKSHEASSLYRRSRYFGYLSARQIAGRERNVHVDIYRGTHQLLLNNVPGSPTECSSLCSINNMCTAQGVVSVGMATSRTAAPSLTGEAQTWALPNNHVTKYTSYSQIAGVAPLPHFCAPGCYTMSAISSHYLESKTPESALGASTEVDGKTYYWYPDAGTSMASPFAAGVMALWLQADNSLTAERAIEIAQRTARTDFADISDPRWGAGCIDALAGMKAIAAEAGLSAPVTDPGITVRPDGHLDLAGHDPRAVKVYSTAGVEVGATERLAKGVYIISIAGKKPYKIVF